MDVSKMCIDSSDVVHESPSTSSSERDSLPSLNDLPLYNNSTDQKQQLQLQYQYLKSYANPPVLEQTDYTQNKNYFPSSSSSLLKFNKPPSPLPPLMSRRPLAPAPQLSPSPPTSVAEDSTMLKFMIDQCSMVYQKIGKYRVDPLRESERNQIIDEIYSTTESLLNSLKEYEIRQQRNSMEEDMAHEMPHKFNGMDEDIHTKMNEATSEEYKLIRQARNLQESVRPKYRRRSKRSMVGQRCHSCNTSETPEWRRGPDGARTLCNACGLHYSKLLRKGSLTVQTHNYMLDSGPESNRAQQAMQFSLQQRKSPPHLSIEPLNNRITELKEEEKRE
ncbi:uncharacterized protein B0P05DRAFT_547743 [Gilbertella persicaria]|uniref:uncharacterized protein n=1 Tax=Gilbertella persicaria TaxID=101096 RepID=UPI00221FB0B9|nr:uncharacterized protein B0P05DRAFT_547743 [Gilbertella persicaria]KAI8074219.1 hypothetical protein B0P05DRAFT_547743 [Gilbertella persicaria]